jgi:hypothetical protein
LGGGVGGSSTVSIYSIYLTYSGWKKLWNNFNVWRNSKKQLERMF